MTDRERVKLLFGPYKPPPFRRGDRAFCLLRDCDVVITGWTGARIPWPRCRPFDNYRGGGWGLLVDEELARAVRNESAAALMHWWRVSGRAVYNWRKALGVTRTSNEGTARLILAAADKGAEAITSREWTEEECDERSRRAIELGLGRTLVLGYHGPRWTPRDIALLGALPDEEVARRTGRTAGAVRQKRCQLGIANPFDGRRRRGAQD